MFGNPVGGPHPPLLSPGTGIHPLFRPRALAVAPPHEGYRHADHPLVSGITALQIQGDPRPESGGGGMWRGERGSAKSAAGERLRRQR